MDRIVRSRFETQQTFSPARQVLGMAKRKENNRSLRGRVVVLLGAAQPAGMATARLLAGEGAKLALVDSDRGALARIAAQIWDERGEARTWIAEASSGERSAALIEDIVSTLGGIDVLIQFIAEASHLAVTDSSWEQDWESALSAGLIARLRLVRLCLPQLAAGGNGRVLFVVASPPAASDSAARTHAVEGTIEQALVGLTRGLAVDLAERGVTVNCVISRPIGGHAPPRGGKVKEHTGEDDGVAYALYALAVPAAYAINGAVLRVGGR
jgi:3-oxoacyl-[acyl-carrier protein] reductase